MFGDKNAAVTIFEFGDFQCPTCGSWFRTQEKLIVQNLVNTGKVNLVWKDFDYYGPDSISASKAARAAGEQGKFWDYYSSLWMNQGDPNSGWASKTNLRLLAQNLGLNMTMFDQSLITGKYDKIINDNFNIGRQLGVKGTPTFFVVGPSGKVIMIVGNQPYSVFQEATDSVR